MSMDKPFVISVSSQKGGVGKTTIAVNVGVALAKHGYKTLLIDADAANPSVALHLGFDDARTGYLDVARGNAKLQDATLFHAPSGLNVLPGKVVTEVVAQEKMHADKLISELHKHGYDFVVIDTSPGIQASGLGYGDADYGLIVTFPFVASCASAVRLSTVFNKHKVKHGLVLNKKMGKSYEIHTKEIEEMYGDRLMAVVEDDEIVPRSIDVSMPAYLYKGNSKFSRSIEGLTLSLITISGKGDGNEGGYMRVSVWERIFGARRR